MKSYGSSDFQAIRIGYYFLGYPKYSTMFFHMKKNTKKCPFIFNGHAPISDNNSTNVTHVVNSNQATSRHMKNSAYRCFLPNLTGFTGSHCVRPNSHHHLHEAGSTKSNLEQEFSLARADCEL